MQIIYEKYDFLFSIILTEYVNQIIYEKYDLRIQLK